MALSENKTLIKSNHTYIKSLNIASSSSDDWSSSYSSDSSDSKTCSENSYNPDWESYINKNGNVFYIEYNIDSQLSAASTTNSSSLPATSNQSSFSSSLKNTLNLSFDRRNKKSLQQTKRQERKMKNVRQKSIASSFNEFASGEIKELSIFIDPLNRIKYDRHTTTLSESILGFKTSIFPNSQRIMVSSMSSTSELQHDKSIEIGDWLKAINNFEINSDNFEQILLNFTQPTTIRLQLKRFHSIDHIHQMNIIKITNTGDFVSALKDLVPVIVEDKLMSGHSTAFTVIYLKNTTEQTHDGSEVIFCYPPKEVNCLYGMRGMFLTLNSLFCEQTFNSKPITTTITIKDTEHYVSYCTINNELLLIGLSSKYATYHDMKQKTIEIIRYLIFINKNLQYAFQSNNQRQYHQLSTIDTNFNINDLFSIQTHRFLATTSHIKFEETLNECHFIPLPRDIQSRIDDTLGEMEAMNYRHWMNEPLKSKRELYIIGSAVYYRKYLLASHLSSIDLLDVETFLRMNGIYLLMDNKNVRDMIIWREIFPMSNERESKNDNNIYGIPNGRWFLSIVGRNQIFMAVILEARHFHDDAMNTSSGDNEIIGPSLFYIEEISDTLDHLRSTGIENLASVWLHSNKRPEVLKEISRENYRFSHSHYTSPSNHHLSIRKSEIISILKRRNNSSENVEGNNNNFGFDLKMRMVTANGGGNGSVGCVGGGTASINSTTLSDGSNQRYDDDCDESDSDWDGFPDSHRSSSGFDLSDVNGLILKEAGDVIPSKITAGQDNVLYHFVHVECGEGIFMAPTTIQSTGQIVSAFRKASLLIHNVLQNTIRFRYLLSQENSKIKAHRSLVAIKEHGVLVSTVNDYDEQIEFWIVGRLYSSPQKELYVCHHADIPQNLIEMAFRLSLNSSG